MLLSGGVSGSTPLFACAPCPHDLELGDDVGGACATLDLSTVPEPLGSYTVTDISSTILWSARPTEANGGIAAENVMKVIHGVEQ